MNYTHIYFHVFFIFHQITGQKKKNLVDAMAAVVAVPVMFALVVAVLVITTVMAMPGITTMPIVVAPLDSAQAA